ncbi:MAG TPA: response regulator, partial [Kofleriaceae bacterium]|nr:response regulator [Kofleriaceae bacterium]
MSQAEQKPSILIVDDDEVYRNRLARAFVDRGYDVRTADGYDSAVVQANVDSPEHAVVDLKMPGPSGLEVVRDLTMLFSKIRIVVLTGHGSIGSAVEAMRFGAWDYLNKPAD